MKRLLTAALLAAFFIVPAKADPISIRQPTVKVTAATSSARVALPLTGGFNVIVQNDSDKTCWFRSGSSTVTALTTDTPVMSKGAWLVKLEPADTYIAAICDTGVSGTVYFTQGPGE